MNYFDFIVLAALAYAAWKGFKKGFIIELFTFLALFVGLYAGIRFSDFLTSVFRNSLGFTSDYVPAVSFTILFLGVGAMIYFGGKVIEKMVKIAQLSLINKLLGVLFSMVKMVFIIGSVILLFESYDRDRQGIWKNTRDGSLFYGTVKSTITTCIPAFESSAMFMEDMLLDDAYAPNIPDSTEINLENP